MVQNPKIQKDSENIILRQPGWLSDLVPPSAQGVILEAWDRVPCSLSACVSAALSLCVSHG